MTVNILIQIDKLVQLLESPVFTCASSNRYHSWALLTAPDLRLQLLEPDKYPHLYKCLYGLLMLLPQSSAFAALKNRLNSVSSIGYLHIAPRPYVAASTPPAHSRQGSVVEAFQFLPPPSPRHASKFPPSSIDTHCGHLSTATTPSASSFDRPNRLKGREEGIIRWGELLEKFRSVQERARRAQRLGGDLDDRPTLGVGDLRITDGLEMAPPKAPAGRAPPVPLKDAPAPTPPAAKPKSGLGRQFGRLGAVGRGKRAQQQQ